MKKYSRLFFVGFLVLVFSTGCSMKENYNIIISKDKEVKIEVLSAMDNEMIDGMLGMNSQDEPEVNFDEEDEFFDYETNDDETNDDELSNGEEDFDFSKQKTYTDEERWKFVESNSEEDETLKDYKKEKYEQGEFKGYKYNTTLGKIDDLTAENGETVNIDKISKDSKIFTKKGDVYTLNVNLGEEDQSQINQYANMIKFDLKLSVTLPYKAKSNNATSVDGTTYTWDLTKAKSIELSFDFKGDNGLNLPLIIGIACGVLLVVVVCVIILTKKKGNKNNNVVVNSNENNANLNNESNVNIENNNQ